MRASQVLFIFLSSTIASIQAWEVSFYEKLGCTLDNTHSIRTLSSATADGNCFTFGNDMPGTGCTEYILTPSGVRVRSCGDPPGWRPHCVYVTGGRGCTIFKNSGCSGDRFDIGARGPTLQFYEGDTTMRSFRCVGSDSF